MYLNDLQSKSQPSLNGFGGINTGVSPFNIGDNEATDIFNLSSEKYPAISPGKDASFLWSNGNEFKITVSGEEVTITEIKYIGALYDGSFFFIGKDSVNYGLYYRYNDGWRKAEITEKDNYGHAVPVTLWGENVTGYSATNFSDQETIIVTGEQMLTVKQKNNSDGIQEVKRYIKDDDEPFPKMPGFVVTKNERLLVASRENHDFTISEYQKAGKYETASDIQVFHVQTEAKQNATALGIFGDVCLYFKRNSTHVLYGKTPLSYSLDAMSHSVGCINHKSIAECETAIMWLAKDGVYAYKATTLPYKISLPVQKYIDNMGDDAVAIADNKRYYLSLSQKDGGYVLLVYDTEFDLWHVEDNPGYTMFTKTEQEGIIGTDGHTLYRIGVGDVKKKWYFVTKPFDLSGISGKTNLKSIYLNISAKKGAKIGISISNDAEGNNFIKIKEKLYIKDDDEKLKIEMPIDKRLRNMPYFRIKISGAGEAIIHGIELHMRNHNNGY